MSLPPLLEQPLVPRFLLAGFAGADGQLMAERRDRTRRRLIQVDTAVAELGGYSFVADRADAPALARLLAEAEARAAEAVLEITGGAFPPRDGDRASLALVLAVQLLLGRYHRGAAVRAAALAGQLIISTIEEREAAASEESEEAEPADPAEADARPPADELPGMPSGPSGEAGPAVILPGQPPVPRSLAQVPALARQLAARTWQLVRFPGRVLLTTDTPVVLWAPSAAAKPYQVGLGSAAEVRVPLDPRHALIVARHGPAGEIRRDLDERHARALNRTVAEAAAEWMYYHVESDPLEGVELPSLASE